MLFWMDSFIYFLVIPCINPLKANFIKKNMTGCII